MNGLSLLATTISVLSFPLVFLALLYPRIASPKRGRWPGFFLYLGVCVTAMLVAVYSASGPNLREENWNAKDWMVLLLGGGLFLAAFTKKWWWSSPGDNESSGSQKPERNQGCNHSKQRRKRRNGKGHDTL